MIYSRLPLSVRSRLEGWLVSPHTETFTHSSELINDFWNKYVYPASVVHGVICL